ncbi:hypothetical protein SAY87_001370 [Trapa incisa]|uniref:Uncharacterized protein n=1 Tax=Trapa incisa TaxID=236973 RepID=A0AAN7GT04_9MYRT|nr:hypothetical protein SAY87_001370 [Trapa incisa]
MLATDNIESTSHNHPSPPHEATTAAKKEGSWSDSLLGQVKKLSLEESSSELSSSKNGNMATATASAFGYPGQAVSLPPPGVVRVYPRALNMTLPSGSVVTVSDDSWIAALDYMLIFIGNVNSYLDTRVNPKCKVTIYIFSKMDTNFSSVCPCVRDLSSIFGQGDGDGLTITTEEAVGHG